MISTEQRNEIVKTHFAVMVSTLGSETKALEFMAWSAKFFSENPNVLREISDPKARDKIFKTVSGLIDNPLLKSLF